MKTKTVTTPVSHIPPLTTGPDVDAPRGFVFAQLRRGRVQLHYDHTYYFTWISKCLDLSPQTLAVDGNATTESTTVPATSNAADQSVMFDNFLEQFVATSPPQLPSDLVWAPFFCRLGFGVVNGGMWDTGVVTVLVFIHCKCYVILLVIGAMKFSLGVLGRLEFQ